MKTNHSILFRLSNKVIQVNFTDKTQIHLNPNLKTLMYINKKSEKKYYELKTAMESNDHEMSKRLKYTKELLTRIYKAKHPDKIANEEP